MRQRMLGAASPVAYQAAGLLVVIGGIGVATAADVGPVEALAATAILTLKALQYGRNVQREYHVCSDLLPFVEGLEERLEALEREREADAGARAARVERIALEEVSFEYEPGLPVLRDVSLSIGPGESVGIVGPSGSGKSTLLQLLLRLREPQRGRILANGEPVSRISSSSWYERVSFVPQEAQLFSDTVLENVRAYRPEVSREDAVEALRLAGLAAELEAMPGGVDADAGERGGRLSGGQRQRVCIARALAGRPDVLLFDEPTSALDAHSEAAVQETLRALRGRTTLVVVAHRLSTLGVCDKILVLKEGRVEAYASREDLRHAAGYFQDVLRLAGLR
jgi:ABC-type multidrug transport system fused ATPase/permease subunit